MIFQFWCIRFPIGDTNKRQGALCCEEKSSLERMMKYHYKKNGMHCFRKNISSLHKDCTLIK